MQKGNNFSFYESLWYIPCIFLQLSVFQTKTFCSIPCDVGHETGSALLLSPGSWREDIDGTATDESHTRLTSIAKSQSQTVKACGRRRLECLH
jgi:hypothetical protein